MAAVCVLRVRCAVRPNEFRKLEIALARAHANQRHSAFRSPPFDDKARENSFKYAFHRRIPLNGRSTSFRRERAAYVRCNNAFDVPFRFPSALKKASAYVRNDTSTIRDDSECLAARSKSPYLCIYVSNRRALLIALADNIISRGVPVISRILASA